MHSHIRGGLGFQLLGVIGAHAVAIERAERLSSVTLNFGNYDDAKKYGDKFKCDRDYLSELLVPDFVLSTVIGTNKFRFFTERNVGLVVKHLDEIRRRIKTKDPFKTRRLYEWPAIHLRLLDRRVVTNEVYERTISVDYGERCHMVSDDYDALRRDFGHFWQTSIVPASEQDDWSFLHECSIVVGGVSSFTISAALLNPSIVLRIIDRKDSIEDSITKEDWRAVEALVDGTPNIVWHSERN